MPNYCYNQYAFQGKKEDLLDLYERIEKYISKPRWDDRPVKSTSYGAKWLGNICLGFGLDPDEQPCRGELCDVSLEENYLYLCCETAWSPNPEMWEAILENGYTDENGIQRIWFDMTIEEAESETFINTDDKHKIFKELYLLDDGDNICRYVNADEVEEACQWLRDEFGCEGDTLEDLVKNYNESHEEEEEISLHEFLPYY